MVQYLEGDGGLRLGVLPRFKVWGENTFLGGNIFFLLYA